MSLKNFDSLNEIILKISLNLLSVRSDVREISNEIVETFEQYYFVEKLSFLMILVD